MGSSRKKSKRTGSTEFEVEVIRCVCGITQNIYPDDTDETWLACGSCGCWQHGLCMGISIVDGESPLDYNCEKCDPSSHKELLEAIDRGIKLWEGRRKLHGKQVLEEDTPQHLGKARKRVTDVRSSRHENNISDAEEIFAQEDVTTLFPLTDECHHYTSIKQVPWDIQK
jgi:hypothetical protein